MMQRRLTLALIAASFLATIAAAAQEKGTWRAVSKTARAITGDVIFSNERITINFFPFTFAEIRGLQPAETQAVFNADDPAGGTGKLYRVSIPAARTFLHKNTLCGGEETQWMATYVSGKSLQLAFFSSPKMPVLSGEALANTTDLCGTYSYAR